MSIRSSSASLRFQDKVLFVQGSLTYDNIYPLYLQSLPYFGDLTSIAIDFSDVKESKSASLVLMIEWLRLCYQKNMQISFHHVNDNLLSIAKVAKLSGLLFPESTDH